MDAITVPFFISHQGCPHTCIFCDQRAISGSTGALPGRNELLARVEQWQVHAAGRPLDVAFFGGTFTALPESAQEQLLSVLQPLRSAGRIRGVRLSTRPDCIDAARVRTLAEYGVHTIELGVQSMDNAVLDAAGRGHSAEDSEAAISFIKNGGMTAVAQLMPGLPGDTMQLSVRSLERVITAGVDAIRIYPVLVMRGTGLEQRYDCGTYCPPGLESGIDTCKRLLHRALAAKVSVLRIGLQAGDGLNSDSIRAGCWHPALGQLVRSQLYFDLIWQKTAAFSEIADKLSVSCHPSRVSDVTGCKRMHLQYAASHGVNMRISTDNTLQKEELTLSFNNNDFKYNIITDLHYTTDGVNAHA